MLLELVTLFETLADEEGCTENDCDTAALSLLELELVMLFETLADEEA